MEHPSVPLMEPRLNFGMSSRSLECLWRTIILRLTLRKPYLATQIRGGSKLRTERPVRKLLALITGQKMGAKPRQ